MRTNARTTPEQSETIRRMLAEGYSHKDIGEAVNKTRKAIQKHCKRHGLKGLVPQGGQHGDKSPFWKRGWIIDHNGYRLILNRNHPFRNDANYVREHRLVMEEHLKRYLLPTEVVHHKDGNKLNNSIENLELYQNNGEHLRVELTGKCPKWSDKGKEALKLAIQKSVATRAKKHSANQKALEIDAL